MGAAEGRSYVCVAAGVAVDGADVAGVASAVAAVLAVAVVVAV